MAATATATKRGPAKRWTRRAMLDAGIQFIQDTGSLPTTTSWKWATDTTPSASQVSGEYGKNGWSTYITTLRREFKKATGETAPERRRGRIAGVPNGVSVLDGKGPKRPLKKNRPAVTESVVIDTPDPVVEDEPVTVLTFWQKVSKFFNG